MTYEYIKNEALSLGEEIVAFRRHLHKYPELSFKEYATSEYIAAFLGREGIDFRMVADTGLVAFVDGVAPDRTSPVVLRADIDAIHVTEQTGLGFASVNEGVMHACGHDVHTACLAGVLKLLNRNRDKFSGTVMAIFQPSEERFPGGAIRIIDEGVFEGVSPKVVIGQHVDPELEVGQFGFRSGLYMAATDEVRITVRGTGGHGGMPHLMTDPVVAAAHMVVALQQIVSRNSDPTYPTVLSIGRFLADGANNVVPSVVELSGTVRTLDGDWRIKIRERIRDIIEGVASAYGVTAGVFIDEGYPALRNDPGITEEMVRLCVDFAGAENVKELSVRMTAEDFSYYAELFPSVFYRLGVRAAGSATASGLHTPRFTADEESIPYGVGMMAASALHYLDKV